MENIIEQVVKARSSKERKRILENFRGRGSHNNVEGNVRVIRSAARLIYDGDDNEKVAALQIICRVFNGFSEFKRERRGARSISYGELLFMLHNCLRLLNDDNGNIRLNASYALNHLRFFLQDSDYAELYFNVLSLRNAQRDAKKLKSIELCLDRIWSPRLDELIEEYNPNEIRMLEIDAYRENDNERDLLFKMEDFVNDFVEETEIFEREIQRIRGENLFKMKMLFYSDNLALFQISYELQKIKTYFKGKRIKDCYDIEMRMIIGKYIRLRLAESLKENLNWMRGLRNREEIFYVDINLEEDRLLISSLEEAYQRFGRLHKELGYVFLK